MSQIRIQHGTAEVTLDSAADIAQANGNTNVHYAERDLLDATAAVLLAVNNPRSVAWAHAIFRLAADQ